MPPFVRLPHRHRRVQRTAYHRAHRQLASPILSNTPQFFILSSLFCLPPPKSDGILTSNSLGTVREWWPELACMNHGRYGANGRQSTVHLAWHYSNRCTSPDFLPFLPIFPWFRAVPAPKEMQLASDYPTSATPSCSPLSSLSPCYFSSAGALRGESRTSPAPREAVPRSSSLPSPRLSLMLSFNLCRPLEHHDSSAI